MSSVNIGSAVGYLELDTSKYTSALAGAQSSLKGFFSSTSTFSSRMQGMGTALQSVGSLMTRTITVGVASAAATVVKSGSAFEKAMSQVAATMGKNKKEIKELNNIAIKMGSTTKFSATEAAEGLNYLALAGYDSKQQISALPKVLQLAAAGDMELDKASDMLTDSMSALGLASKDSKVLMSNMDVMVNQMAKTASKSNTSVAQLGEAILTVGGTAKDLKGGTKELNTVLGLLADNGIKASESGTHLRNIILAMTPTTDKAAAAWDKLGVSGFDAQGNLRPLEDTFQDLSKAMDGMSTEERQNMIKAMFNKTDLAAVNALLSTSKDRWDELGSEIENSQGAAEKMANTQLDNLAGDVTLLKSAIEGLQIRFYQLANNGLRLVVQSITKVVDWLNNLDDSTLETIEKIALVAAAVGPVLIIVGKLFVGVSKISSAISVLSTSFFALSGAGGILSALGAGAGALVAALGPIIAIIAAIVLAVIGFKAAWDDNFGGIRDNTAKIVKSLKTLFSGIFDGVKEALSALVDAWNSDWGGIKTSVEEIIAGIVEYISWFLETATAIMTALKEAWENDFMGIRTVVTTVFDDIGTAFSGFLALISGIIRTINQLLKGDFSGAFETIKSTLSAQKMQTFFLLRLLFAGRAGRTTTSSVLVTFVSIL